MATSSVYIPGQESSSTQANTAYQEALDKMLKSLDARQNRLFDPTLLAFSEAMLTPGRTGSFGEALGRAAGGVREAEAQRAKEDQELAKMRLELAGVGLNIEQQKARERAFMAARGVLPSGMQPGAAPTAAATPPTEPAPAGTPALPRGGITPSAAPSAAPTGFEGTPGVQVSPGDPGFLGRMRYLEAAQLDPAKTLPQALKEAEELERQRYQEKEGGVFDRATGMFYQFPKGESVERQIGGRTYKIPASAAALLDLYQSTNNPRYTALAEQLTKSGVGGPLKSVTESEVEKVGDLERAKVLAQAAAKKESSSEERATAARQMLFNANRVQQLVAQSPHAVGIFSRPTLMSALGTLVSKGIQTPGGSLNLGGFEDAVRQAMPGVKQRDIDNVTMAAGALAEIELAYTVLYMQKQGAITEGEREVVRRIGGNLSQSPAALIQKARLIQMRSQHDIDTHQAWQTYQEMNPRASYDEFEKSKLNRDIQKEYDKNLANAFSVQPPRSTPGVGDMKVRRVGQ